MKKYLLLTSVILSMAISVTGCGNAEENNKDINVTSITESQTDDISEIEPEDKSISPQGEAPTGDMPQGEKPEGEPPTGDMPQGEKPEGEPPTGDMPQGKLKNAPDNKDGSNPELTTES